jgi:hypothetical protein
MARKNAKRNSFHPDRRGEWNVDEHALTTYIRPTAYPQNDAHDIRRKLNFHRENEADAAFFNRPLGKT